MCELKADKKLDEENDERNGLNGVTDENDIKSGDGFHTQYTHPNERNSFDMLRTKPISDGNELLRQKSKQLEVRNQECDQLRC